MMRYGFTTGSCAAAASKAAAYMLLTGVEKKNIAIDTPKGITFYAEILDIRRTEGMVSCAVQKDGGDDPDITTGTLIYSSVSIEEDYGGNGRAVILVDGGNGVGRVTKPGLDQPAGNAAINHVPREMIIREVTEVCSLTDFNGILRVTVSVPDGEALAEHTFNPRLGIAGGISILGTSGIVEPMSSQAMIDTIRVELRQKKAEGFMIAAVSPGNYGLDYMKKAYDYDLDESVKCSNYIGLTVDMAAETGFEGMLLTGHIGKLVKVAGGIMNTHSHEGDCRMELIAASAVREHVSTGTVEEILDCVTAEEAVRLLAAEDKCGAVMERLMGRIQYNLNKRAAGRIKVETIMYSNEFGELAKSAGADEMVKRLQYIIR